MKSWEKRLFVFEKSFSRKIAKKILKTGKLSIKNIAFHVFFFFSSVFLVVILPEYPLLSSL